MKAQIIALSALVAFLFGATAGHAVDPVAKCQANKLKAWAKRRSCEHNTAAKAALGLTVDVTTCQANFVTTMAKAGTLCRYLATEPGTVTDLDTGLMWQRTTDLGEVTDKDNQYSWNTGELAGFLATLNNCQSSDAVVVSGGYAGHCDWRLPQATELVAIRDCSMGTTCLDESAFGPLAANSYYWSATAWSDNTAFSWAIQFGEALDDAATGRGAALSARAVRRTL